MLKLIFRNIIFILLLLLVNENLYPSWTEVEEVSGSSCILPFGDIILVGSDNGIYLSTDGSLSWSHYTVDTLYPVITDLAKNDDYIFAGTYNGVYASADTGKTWNHLGPEFAILSVFAKDSIVLACIQGGGLFQSENNGQIWTCIDGNHFYSYLVTDNKILAGTFTGIYESFDNGLSWKFVDLPSKITTSLAQNEHSFFATNYTYGIYRSDDFGGSWSQSNSGIPLSHLHPYSVYAKDSLIFTGLTSNKIYLSMDNGLNWQDFSNGLNINEETYHVKFAVSGNKIYASFLYNSLWYYDLSQITNISELNNSIPDGFILQQNYPNPFNPTTKINYSIPNNCHVKITVYDVTGREILTLVNRYQNSNEYSISFDASGLASGIYFYNIKAGDFVQTKRMLLIK